MDTDRKTQILKEALRLFSEHGVEGASLRELARRVGLTQPSLYHYFPSKEALVEAIFSWKTEEALVRQRASFDEETLKTPQRFCLTLAQSILSRWQDPEQIAFMRLVHGEAMRGGKTARSFALNHIAPLTKSVAEVFSRFIKEGKIRAVDPEHAARSFVSPLILLLMHHYLMEPPESPSPDLQDFIHAHTDLFLHGVAR